MPEIIVPDGYGDPLHDSFARGAFVDALERLGIWVVYIRANHEFPCMRCNAVPGEGKGDCPECFGLGYKASLERQKIVIAKGRRTMPADTDQIPGQYADSRHRAFFLPATMPQTSDLILEVTWSCPDNVIRQNGEPASILHVYSLEQIEPYYIEGAPAYYSTKLDTFDHHISGILAALKSRR